MRSARNGDDDIFYDDEDIARLNRAADLRPAVSFGDVARKLRSKVATVKPKQWLTMSALIVLLLVGNALQIIGINFWLRAFGTNPSASYVSFVISNFVFGLFFVVLLAVYFIRPSRPTQIWFAVGKRALVLITVIGFFDAFNSWMSIYATVNTPEVLQALFSALTSIWCFVFSKWLLKDTRSYCNRWAILSFAFLMSGVGVATLPHFVTEDMLRTYPWLSALTTMTSFSPAATTKAISTTMTSTSELASSTSAALSRHSTVGPSTEQEFLETVGVDGRNDWWVIIFFLSIPPRALYNVLQSKYLNDYTFDGRTAEYKALPKEAQRVKGTDSTVKVVMLFGDTLTQFIFSLMFLPADAIPGWGPSATVSEASTNFASGVSCVATCPNNFLFALMYSLGFVFTYIGSAYLNHYSATLCSMVSQLSSPVTALLLVIIPAWNLNPGYTPWYLSVIAVVLLIVGTVVYALWEELSEMERPTEIDYGDDVVVDQDYVDRHALI